MAFWTFNGKVFLTCFCQLSMGFNLITKSVETLRLTLRLKIIARKVRLEFLCLF